jgi:hypothetical protein
VAKNHDSFRRCGKMGERLERNPILAGERELTLIPDSHFGGQHRALRGRG